MAAAVSSRSRGAAGGLFFLFTLLGLVCTAVSLDENQLKHFKKKLQEAEQDLDTVKEQRDTVSELSNGCISLLDLATAFMSKSAEHSPECLKGIKYFREEAKSRLRDNEELSATILKWEQALRDLKKKVQALEEYHAEL